MISAIAGAGGMGTGPMGCATGSRTGSLGPDEAIALLRQVVGPTRVDAEPTATAELARRRAGLPLALRIAAEWVTNRPHHGIADLAAAR